MLVFKKLNVFKQQGVDRKVNGNLMNLIEESTNSGERTGNT